jgi:hypothetical protein
MGGLAGILTVMPHAQCTLKMNIVHTQVSDTTLSVEKKNNQICSIKFALNVEKCSLLQNASFPSLWQTSFQCNTTSIKGE